MHGFTKTGQIWEISEIYLAKNRGFLNKGVQLFTVDRIKSQKNRVFLKIFQKYLRKAG
jgi:hypothetical protein